MNALLSCWHTRVSVCASPEQVFAALDDGMKAFHRAWVEWSALEDAAYDEDALPVPV
jgi:hypothetical protein